MIATNSSLELLRLETIRETLRSSGPCITILLPPYHPGEPQAPPATLLNDDIKAIERELGEQTLENSVRAELLQPLRSLADPLLNTGAHWGRSIFCSPTKFDQFQLRLPVQASLSVGGSFGIRKIAAELTQPWMFYILALSKKRVGLLRCEGLHAEAVKLGRGVPETLEDALALDQPDHDLENRSAAGRAPGAMHGIRFGTGSEPERGRAHLHDFYKLVDRGLKALIHAQDIPAVLAGVEEDTDLYREISTYRNLVNGSIHGSPHVEREQHEMLQQAYSILRVEDIERQRTDLLTLRDRTAPSRFSTDPDTILNAAFDGRVSHLYVDEGAERIGKVERDDYRSWVEEDLLNVAMAQTLIHRGVACSLPTEMMPEKSTAFGFMRF